MKHYAYHALFIAVIFIFLFSIQPASFPVADDYAHFFSVDSLVKTGEVKIHLAVTAAILFQIFYGYIFSIVFGLSHLTLMMSTVVLAGLTVIATYLLLREFFSVKMSMLGSLLLLVNPFFFYLSHTFMTDVPAMLFIVLSIFSFHRGVKRNQDKYIILGAVFSLIGFWVRQYAILTIAGMVFFYLLKKRDELKKVVNFLLFFILPTLFFIIWFILFQKIRGPPTCPYDIGIGSNLAKNFLQMLIFIGYFFFPLGILFLVNFRKILRMFEKLHITYKIFIVLIVAAAVMLPFVRGIVGLNVSPFSFSLFGPKGLGTTPILGVKNFLLPYETWIPFFALSVIVMFSLLVFVLGKLGEKKLYPLIFMTAFLLLPMTLYFQFYERYYLAAASLLLPFVIALSKDLKWSKQALIFSIVLLGIISWYGLYDNFSFNNARWDGINSLLGKGIAENKIDGGFEYDARFFEGCNSTKGVLHHGWAYSLSDEYVISFNELENYKTLKSIDYLGPFGEKHGTIFVLQKVV